MSQPRPATPLSSLPAGSADPVALASHQQFKAADPRHTAWVDASAGSGKTTVLINRVLRLLLAGTAPHRLLCLTYTKAAAANMANRLTATLARWAVMEDAALAPALHKLTGQAPDDETLLNARRLFARSLDTPGGMQFQTIHGFCQSLLARFPLEARVPVGFNVLDERASRALLDEARQHIFERAAGAPLGELDAAITHLLEKFGPEKFPELDGAIIAQRSQLEPVLGTGHGLPIARLHALLGLPEGLTEDKLVAAFCQPGARAEDKLRHALQALAASTGSKDKTRAAQLNAWLACQDAQQRADMLESYFSVYLTADGNRLKDLAVKAIATAQPDVIESLDEEAQACLAFIEQRRAVRTYTTSAALIIYAASLLLEYQQLKAHQLALDFDDLIARATALVTGPGAASWVLFKLDGGIDHVLVDEAQDTNPLQWQLLKALTSEFYSGSGRYDEDITRTMFAVGDFKQSIFSFQGARPQAFIAARDDIRQQALQAQLHFEKVDFVVSFRTVAAVLAAVDAVFAQDEAAQGLPDYQHHISVHQRLPGRVDLWPPAPGQKKQDDTSWRLPLQRTGNAHPRTKLARVIAAQIRQWVDSQTQLPARSRAVRYGDIMVLVRQRGAFVPELIRACKQLGVPVAGADRMKLLDQLAVEDVLAFARFLLLPEDDLTLACVLKGPLIGLDDAQLFAIAHHRQPLNLWQSLGRHEATRPLAAWLADWLKEADRITPYTLMARLLAQPCPADSISGKRAMLGRLGPEAADPLDELLAIALQFEQRETPSLQGFLHWIESDNTVIKRELEQAGDQVRIMTVHGSKGLEAPVVILADAYASASDKNEMLVDPDMSAPPMVAPRKDEAAPARARRQQLRQLELEEYHRLLYVALTRAEDWLIIGSWLKGNQEAAPESSSGAASWYQLAERGMLRLAAQTQPYDFTALLPDMGWQGAGLCFEQTGDMRRHEKHGPTQSTSAPLASLPDWLMQPPAAEPLPARPLTPAKEEDDAPILSPLAEDDSWRWQRGITIHRLLQTLPDLPAPQRRAAGLRWLAHLPPAAAHRTLDEVLAVIEGAAFAHLFGPHSRAEVPVTGLIGSRVIAGQIDRLAVDGDTVYIIDFKTNRPPARQVSDVPAAYLRQLASYRAVLAPLYPGKQIQALLLWTNIPELMPIPAAILDAHAPQN